MSRGDEVLLFIDDPVLRPAAIYEATNDLQTTDKSSEDTITCVLRFALPSPSELKLSEEREHISRIASVSPLRDTRSVGLHQPTLQLLSNLYAEDTTTLARIRELLDWSDVPAAAPTEVPALSSSHDARTIRLLLGNSAISDISVCPQPSHAVAVAIVGGEVRLFDADMTQASSSWECPSKYIKLFWSGKRLFAHSSDVTWLLQPDGKPTEVSEEKLREIAATDQCIYGLTARNTIASLAGPSPGDLSGDFRGLVSGTLTTSRDGKIAACAEGALRRRA